MTEETTVDLAPDLHGVSDEHFAVCVDYIEAVLNRTGCGAGLDFAHQWSDDWDDPLELVVHLIGEGSLPESNYNIGCMLFGAVSLSLMLAEMMMGQKEQAAGEEAIWQALTHSFEKAKILSRIARAKGTEIRAKPMVHIAGAE